MTREICKHVPAPCSLSNVHSMVTRAAMGRAVTLSWDDAVPNPRVSTHPLRDVRHTELHLRRLRCPYRRKYTTCRLHKPFVAHNVGVVTATDEVDADLGAAFAALGDRTRRAIVARLARGEATVGELAEPFDLTHQSISRHVGVLRRCGLIHQRVDGQRRPCRLNVERMQELSGWINAQQREWESRLNRLEGHLASLREERH